MAGQLGESLGWIVLAALLTATLIAAFLFNRAGRPSLVGDEATYAMQAASLAWDFDLAYSRSDYDRFVRQWGGPPDGVILQSRDHGAHLVYGKPFLYALVVAPFVRLAPVRGALVANALLLAAAALLAARTLGRNLGAVAPLWVAVFLFGSVSFAYVFWVHADLFLLAATAAGFALAYGGEGGGGRLPGDRLERAGSLPGGRLERAGSLPGAGTLYGGAEAVPAGRFFARWCAAGALLAAAGAYRPFYLLLLLPAAFAVPPARRRAGLAGLACGALGLLLATALVQWAAGGGWSGYAGERRAFYARTGYPEVDFPASGWDGSLRRWGNTSWLQEGAFDPNLNPRLWAWNGIYFLAGRNVGVLPYFLPLVLGFAAFRGGRGRWLLWPAAAAAAACFLLVRPFNFYGGGGAIGNRYFLPLYPALWFMAARFPQSARRGAATALLAAAAAAPFLWPLWRHPGAFPVGEDGRYRHVSRLAELLLPYETTQSHIPGGQDSVENGLWLKLLNRNVWRDGEGGGLRMMGNARAELLVGSPGPLSGVALELDRNAPSRLAIGGQELRPDLLLPDGSISFDVPLGRPRAVHPMWWTRDDYYLYELEFSLPGARAEPIGMRLRRGQELIHRFLPARPQGRP
ncbi:MAG TPA: hypothetical protein VHQ90_18610 [Thermoanaerobaculia bacterium]|nr:hypothetical protein [Thermoanaerobaculia bacterium]